MPSSAMLRVGRLHACAARRTARRMRMCVPHRHRLGIMWRRICVVRRRRVFFQQRLRAHDHSGDAIAALRRLLVDERTLQRARVLVVPSPSTVLILRPAQHRDRRQAGKNRFAVDHHRARAALAQPAAELGAVHRQMIAQHIEQRRIRIGVDALRSPLTLSSIIAVDPCARRFHAAGRETSGHGVAAWRSATRRYASSDASWSSVSAPSKPGIRTPFSPRSGQMPSSTICNALRGSGA